MTISIEYFKELNFIKTTISDTLDDRELLAHVEELNRVYSGLKSVIEFADCRGVVDISHLTQKGVEYCASLEKDKPGSRLVILIPGDNSVLNILAGTYEAMAENFREQVVVLNELDDAIEWLTDDIQQREMIEKVI